MNPELQYRKHRGIMRPKGKVADVCLDCGEFVSDKPDKDGVVHRCEDGQTTIWRKDIH